MKPNAQKQMSFEIPKGAPAVFKQRQLDDESPFPFGKHKGENMMMVPISYLNWFLKQDWAAKWPSVVEYAKRAQRGMEQDQQRQENS